MPSEQPDVGDEAQRKIKDTSDIPKTLYNCVQMGDEWYIRVRGGRLVLKTIGDVRAIERMFQ